MAAFQMAFWTPIHFSAADLVNRGSHYLHVVARLKPGASLVQAREEMSSIARQLAKEYPDNDKDIGAVVDFILKRRGIITSDYLRSHGANPLDTSDHLELSAILEDMADLFLLLPPRE